MPKDLLKKALEVFGKDYIEALGKELAKAGKDASGNLKRSLDYKVKATGFGTSYTLQILAEDYLKYVDEGRRAGAKQPPIQAIKDWVQIKGLPEGIEFAIAKSISKKGIKKTEVIAKALKKVQTDASFRKLEDGVSDWVDDIITDKLIGLSKNKNITFK